MSGIVFPAGFAFTTMNQLHAALADELNDAVKSIHDKCPQALSEGMIERRDAVLLAWIKDRWSAAYLHKYREWHGDALETIRAIEELSADPECERIAVSCCYEVVYDLQSLRYYGYYDGLGDIDLTVWSRPRLA